MNREQTKAAFYIQQLHDSRSHGNWQLVPEQIRKIKKHGPHRSCLIITAECEHAIAVASYKMPTTDSLSRFPTSNTSTVFAPLALADVSKYIQPLTEAIKSERTYVEDRFQAQACLSSIYWHLGEFASAISKLPSSIAEEYTMLLATIKEPDKYTRLCALKASQIKGSSQQKINDITEALDTYESILPVLSSIMADPKQGKEITLWTELFLTSFCMFHSNVAKKSIASSLPNDTLSAFRLWTKFWDIQSSVPVGGRAPYADFTRRSVWGEYYRISSNILQHGLQFSVIALPTAHPDVSLRLQQRAEIKRVGAHYESLLIDEIHFPKSYETSDEVEEFVEIVMRNWRVLCGTDWNEQDIGEGGIEALSRDVLDTLYRAAKKTFHSAAVIRHLFTVHLAVAEFELSSKAFDTYMFIVKKGKAGTEKSGNTGNDLDSDEMVLRVASRFIEALCRYKSHQAAQKAVEVSQLLEGWLEACIQSDLKKKDNGTQNVPKLGTPNGISPASYALAWRCVGIGHAQWARTTFDAASRSEIQLKAITCFRKALLPQYESTTDLKTLYALGIILAERREISAAIETVKSGLRPSSLRPSLSGYEYSVRRLHRERVLIPLWHLLALLLSARQDFLTARKSCEVVFERFQNPKNLFRDVDLDENHRSYHSNEIVIDQDQGIMKDFDDSEKENLLEVKMTQLTLIELLDGPDVAVNACDELLRLYLELFGDAQGERDKASINTILSLPPKSPTDTIKSFRAGIFGHSGRKSHANAKHIDQSVGPPKSPTSNYGAPAIHVTSENIQTTKQTSLAASGRDKLKMRSACCPRKTDSKSLNYDGPSAGKLRSQSSKVALKQPGEEASIDSRTQENVKVNPNHNYTDASTTQIGRPSSRGSTMSDDRKPVGPAVIHDTQDSGTFKPLSPVFIFPKSQQRRGRLIVLIRVWLLISGFYRRASMYDDALGAIDEARQLVVEIESDESSGASINQTTNDSTWRSSNEIAELWSDVHAELGYLAVAEKSPHYALAHFDTALTHLRDHPNAIVSLSNILMDIYTEELPLPPSVPALDLPKTIPLSCSNLNASNVSSTPIPSEYLNKDPSYLLKFQQQSFGFSALKSNTFVSKKQLNDAASDFDSNSSSEDHRGDSSTALLTRLAARDRAYGLLTVLTKSGAGWSNSEAWFALARAYEESGQANKAREVLWWCVELEDSRAVRDWTVVGSGGYVL